MKRTTSMSSVGRRERDERDGRAGRPGSGWWKRSGTSLLGFGLASFIASGTMALEAERPAGSAPEPEDSAAQPSDRAVPDADGGWIARALEPASESRSEIAGDRGSERPATETQTDTDVDSDGDSDAASDAAEPEGEKASSAADVAHEQSGSGDSDEQASERGQVQTEIDSLVSEFLATSEAVADRPDGKRPVAFTGSKERPDWYQALVVTNKANPLLEEECKKEALSISVETLRKAHGIEEESAALQQAAHHMREHQDFAASHSISYADYLNEIASCRAFCAPLVAHLVRCQVLAVSHSPHGILLFDLDSDQVDPRYENGLIDEAVEALQEDPGSRVLLAGRASKIGDLRYNRRLSARRALAVRDKLIEQGAPADRVKTMWFGWEPPQISSWIASRYGLDSLYAREGGHRMNQSVMLVIYPGSDDVEEKNDETVADTAEDEDVLSTAQLSAP